MIQPSSVAVDLLKLAPTLIEMLETETQKIIVKNLVDRCKSIEVRGVMEPYIIATTSVDIKYTNPETGVIAILPAGTSLGWLLIRDSLSKDYYAPSGINLVNQITDDSYFNAHWDCTDYYDDDGSSNPRFRSILGSLSMIDLLIMHATNLDGYDGTRSSSSAKSKYVGSFHMILENVPDVEEDFSDHGSGYYCAGCDNHYEFDESEVEVLGEWVCRSCFESYIVSCNVCNRYIWSDESVSCFNSTGDIVYVCNDHYKICDACGGSYTHGTEFRTMSNGWCVCDSCYESKIVCSSCFCVVDQDKAVTIDEKHYCSSCGSIKSSSRTVLA